MATMQYTGPALLHLSPDDLLIVWKYLAQQPTEENESLRKRIRDLLESRAENRDSC